MADYWLDFAPVEGGMYDPPSDPTQLHPFMIDEDGELIARADLMAEDEWDAYEEHQYQGQVDARETEEYLRSEQYYWDRHSD